MTNSLIGQTFGRLNVIEEYHQRAKNGARLWMCICSCGRNIPVEVTTDRLKSGKTRSCGCLQSERAAESNRKRAKWRATDRGTRLHRIWKGMIARTTYRSQEAYKNYGGRGITVCDEWRNSFEAFYNWAMVNGYRDDLTIDRIDTNGNYYPENCEWVTRKAQNNNQRSNIVIDFNGVEHTAAQWAEIMGVSYGCIYKRIRRGKPKEEILKEYVLKVGE